MDCGPKQTAGLGTESGVAYKPSQRTQPLQHRRWAQVAECDTSDKHSQRKRQHRVHTWEARRSAHKLWKQRTGPGSQNKCTQAPRQRGRAMGAEGRPHKSLWSRRIHTSTHLASFGQQHRAGQGNRSMSNDHRGKYGAGGTADILKGPL